MDYIRLAHVADFAKIRMKSYRMMGRLIAIIREREHEAGWMSETVGSKS